MDRDRDARRPLLAVLSIWAVLCPIACDRSHDSAAETSCPGSELPAGQERCPAYQAGWTTIHGDCHNSDVSSAEVPSDITEEMVLSPGYAAIVGGTVDDIRRQAYLPRAASAQGDGAGLPNLVVYDGRTGEVMWTSADWASDVPLGPCAVISSPLIAANGDVYLSDCQNVFASDPNGNLKWRSPMPIAPGEPAYSFVTGVFARTGEMGGVTQGGKVVFFDATTGELLDTLQLPQPPEPEESPAREIAKSIMTECLWVGADGAPMVEPSVVEIMIQGFLGVGVAVGNTPAAVADPDKPSRTRIFVPGVVDFNGDGKIDTELYRIDFDADTRKLTFVEGFDGRIESGGGSATSPDVTGDGKTVIIGDNEGVLHGFCAESGREVWQVESGRLFGSATTDLDAGIVYVGSTEGVLVGFDVEHLVDGKPPKVLEVDYSTAFIDLVPDLPGRIFPRATVLSGLVVKTPEHFLLPFTVGYRVEAMGELSDVALWPMRSILVIVDSEGRIAGTPRELGDVVEAGATTDGARDLLVAHTSITSSLAHCLYRRPELFDRLPGSGLRLLPEPIRPRGGVTVFR